jgi:hypothetical protein
MRLVCVLSIALVVAGCARSDEPSNRSIDINAAADAAQNDIDTYAANHSNETNDMVSNATVSNMASTDTAGLAPLDPPAPGTPGGLPDDKTPVSEAKFTPDSAQGGANVVQLYYALLGIGKYGEAWKLWDQGGAASKMTAPAFAASFAKYSEYHANVGAPGRIDAGAGQRYVTVPVQVYARLKSGEPVYEIGSATLHRAGDIDGATDEQKTWHLSSIDLKPAPKRK